MLGKRLYRGDGKRRIADTNILVRYLTGDNETAIAKAMEIIGRGVEILPEEIPETLYVLTSKVLYNIPRKAAVEALQELLDEISVEKKEVIRQARYTGNKARLHRLSPHSDGSVRRCGCVVIRQKTQ